MLGRGGMGAVYEAENTWTQRRVALKVMRASVADDEVFVRRFMQEARTASQLQHPNIVDVLDMGQDATTGEIFIVQEFLSGRDLGRLLAERGTLSVREAFDVMVPVMEALVAAHARGIVHRDLKPENIFLAETAKGVVPTLIDFGIAKVVVDDASLQQTGTGVLLGTPDYMSPEQARGESALDGRSDVWALGVVLYELLSGKKPYTAANANALIAKIIYEAPTPLDVVAPQLSPAVVDLVMRAVRPALAERHATMQAFLDALRATDARTVDASAPAPVVRAAAAPPLGAGQHATAATAETFAPVATNSIVEGRRSKRSLALAAFVFAGASVGALVALRSSAGAEHAAASLSAPVEAPVTIVRPAAPVVSAAAASVLAPMTTDAGPPVVATPAPAQPAPPVAPAGRRRGPARRGAHGSTDFATPISGAPTIPLD